MGGWAGESPRPPACPAARLPATGAFLSPATFARRIERAQAELTTRKWDVLIATPGANYRYFTGDTPGSSERLIALIVPVVGDAAIVCPAFEVDRIRAQTAIQDVRGWEEQANPYDLVKQVVRARKPRGNGTIALEASTGFASYLHLKNALEWKFEDATEITARLRSIKSAEEVALIRRAIAITEDALAATFAQLTVGMSERDAARMLTSEMDRRGAAGDGLVQFGASSALPHGGPASATLQRESVVLIDCGCTVAGYTSDITRTVWFGDHRPPNSRRPTISSMTPKRRRSSSANRCSPGARRWTGPRAESLRRVASGRCSLTAWVTASDSRYTNLPISWRATRPVSSPGWCSRSSPGSIRRESSESG